MAGSTTSQSVPTLIAPTVTNLLADLPRSRTVKFDSASLSLVAAKLAPTPAKRTTRGKSAPKPTRRTAWERHASPPESIRQSRNEHSLATGKRKRLRPLPAAATQLDKALERPKRPRTSPRPLHSFDQGHEKNFEGLSPRLPTRDRSSSERPSNRNSRRELPLIEPDDYGDPLLPNPGVSSPQKRKSNLRNDDRLSRAKAKDEKIMSKYLCVISPLFITATVLGPDDNFTPPPWLLKSVQEVAMEKVVTPKSPPIQFSMHRDAASYNSMLLAKNGFNLDRIIEGHRNTTLDYGSEF